jgi:beta-alanine degradation protein BauB
VELRVATPQVVIDNQLVRVTRWRLEENAQIPTHRHEMPYVVVPVVGGTIHFSSASEDASSELVAGEPYFRAAGVEHTVSTDATSSVVFIEVELKGW